MNNEQMYAIAAFQEMERALDMIKEEPTPEQIKLQRDFFLGTIWMISAELSRMGETELGKEIIQNCTDAFIHPETIIKPKDEQDRVCLLAGLIPGHYEAAKLAQTITNN